MIPASLQAIGPFGLALWQWAAIPIVLVGAIIVGAGLASATRVLATRIAARTAVAWDDVLVARSAGPLRVGWTLVIVRVALPFLELPPRASAIADRLLSAGIVGALFWAASRGIDIARELVGTSRWADARPATRSLVPLGARIAKVALIIAAVASLLAALGYPAASLLAGLGIGGLALALAAQKTVENLFGSLSLAVDQPFRVGDFVQVDGFVATVETIGLRSTQFRTLDRTLVTIPNGRLADMKIESFAARDRIRLACTIGLVYATTGEQLRAVLAGFERVLRAHHAIWPDAVVVRLESFGESAINVQIMAWFQTSDFGEFQRIRQEVLLAFIDVVEDAETSFAFPTRTVHLIPG